MRICFVNEGSVEGFSVGCKSTIWDGEQAEIILFSFDGLGEVSYDKELKGETALFAGLTELSKKAKCIVVGGCITQARGHKRKSAVVAEDGRMIGIADMLHVIDGETGSGASLRVFETKIGKMGVVVGNDVFFPEVFKSLALCGSDFIVCVYERMAGIEQVLIRANAFSYGVPVFFCATGYALLADATGEVAFAAAQSPAFTRFTPKKEYHLVETRRRGFIRSSNGFY